ncbi:MAG TPA: efflux transporter periplasmic adaptor subunit, partial [Dehalococcoidia bacterium]|nr:efflux transporter periplasmic adaptor subunit [Dehalococcoidia bacterium]
LVYRDNRLTVFKIESNQARQLDVEIGLANADRVEILEGVLPGDRVIVSNHQLLVDGALVVAADP